MAAKQLLTPNDAAFFVAETEVTPQVTAMLTLLNRTPNLGRLKKAVLRGIEHLPRMRSVLNVQRYRALIPASEFDIDQHVRLVYQPEIEVREQLLETIGRLHSEPLPQDRPLWQVLLVSNKNPETNELPCGAVERAAILWRLHHAVGDGVSSMALLQTIMSDKLRSNGDDKRPTQQLDLQAPPRTSFREYLQQGSQVARVVARTSRARATPSPLNGQNTPLRRLTPIELDRVRLRSVMRRHGVTLHDVVLALLTSVLRRYHLHHGAATDRDLLVIVPHSSQPIPRSGVQNNSVGLLWVQLAIAEADPVARLRRTAAAVAQAKVEGWIQFSKVFPPFIARMPLWMQRRAFTKASTLTNAVCTIMPARLHELKIDGQSAEESYVAAPLLESHGAAFTFMTSGRAIRGSIVSDPGIVSDPLLLASFMNEAQHELTG